MSLELGRWYGFEFMLKANTVGERDVVSLKINHGAIGLNIKSSAEWSKRKRTVVMIGRWSRLGAMGGLPRMTELSGDLPDGHATVTRPPECALVVGRKQILTLVKDWVPRETSRLNGDGQGGFLPGAGIAPGWVCLI